MRMRHGHGHSSCASSQRLGRSRAPFTGRKIKEFCKGFDFRRTSGFTCNQIFEHEIDGVEYMANFSCCKECAERAVECGYAVWSKKSYPMALR